MQNRIEFINYYSIGTKSNKLESIPPRLKLSNTTKGCTNESLAVALENKPVGAQQACKMFLHPTVQDIYSFGDDKFQITMHDNVNTNGHITHNAIIKFSVVVKSDGIIPKQKPVCEHDFYFNYSTNTIVIGKIKEGKYYECVRINPINSKSITLDSLLYNLPENARKACSQCNGSLYLLITYYIINFIITKKYINPILTTTFTLYDNAVRESVSNNAAATIKKNNIKLSVEQLIKYSRTYYEAFGFLPHIIYTTDINNLSKDITHLNNSKYHIIAPTDPNYVQYLAFLVYKRKEILNMEIREIKQLLNNTSANKTISNFFKIKTTPNGSSEYLLFINVNILKNEIMPNVHDNSMKLNNFLSIYPDIDRIHSLFFLPESVKDIVIDKRVIRIYTPQNILEQVLQIYKGNTIQIYEPYFRTVKLIQ